MIIRLLDKIQVGGQDYNVKVGDKYQYPALRDDQGLFNPGEGQILIDARAPMSAQQNTFIHELVHCILYNMGQYDLERDETFVNTFAGFMSEALRSIDYDIK